MPASSPGQSLAPVRIATRASALALWQAEHVAGLLRRAAPERAVEIVHVSTTGDREQSESLRSFGGVGVFTREVQKALLDGRADIAVHSLKDLPTETSPELALEAVPERGPTADALVLPASRAGTADLGSLPPAACVGTGALRRQAQLLYLRPDLQLVEVRGNVETRLRKLDEGNYDALVLAVAGLTRLGVESRIAVQLVPPVMYPAVGQGALALECRADDVETKALLLLLNHPPTFQCVLAERILLAELRAGCHAPVGAATRIDGETLHMEAIVLSPRGKTRLLANGFAPVDAAAQLGRDVAEELRRQGANEVIHAR